MSSTYSPDLRITLIGTGDQSGTWGGTTNTNLGTLIEDAITACANVVVGSANQALTANNGTADEARCAALSLTTSTSANFNVYIPPSDKLYVVHNASSYVATLYCSTSLGNTTAAGTGIAIPAGKKMALWTDGTNVYQQVDHLISPTLASPTMTAPVLGTPASGTLTNCTFPTLNQDTTGSAGSLVSTNFSIVESGGVLYFKYGTTNIAAMDSSGNLTTLADITAYGTP